MSGTTTRIAVAAAAAFGLVTIALPASAAETVYSPGDIVSVDGASIVAPAPGQSVAISVDRLTGVSTSFSVSTSDDGVVTVTDDAATASSNADSPAAAPNKCNDSAYSVLNGGVSWPGTYNWHIKTNSVPNELTEKSAVDALKTSVNNITSANNGCKLADQVSAKASYKGSTNASSDVTANLQCVDRPNGQNVTEFGKINSSGVLAATCTYSDRPGGKITNASVLINTNFEWWTGGKCNNAIGLKATMTHEYGHAYGLGHVDEAKHGNLTMSTNINSDCSNFEASLGKGDVLALRKLY